MVSSLPGLRRCGNIPRVVLPQRNTKRRVRAKDGEWGREREGIGIGLHLKFLDKRKCLDSRTGVSDIDGDINEAFRAIVMGGIVYMLYGHLEVFVILD